MAPAHIEFGMIMGTLYHSIKYKSEAVAVVLIRLLIELWSLAVYSRGHNSLIDLLIF